MKSEFPTAPAFGIPWLWRRGKSSRAKASAPHFPKVLVVTPAPPALRERRIGKETSLPEFSCLLDFLDASF